MHMDCLVNTQAYNAFVFIIKDNTLKFIIKNNTLKYIWTCVIWVCYHQNLSLHELNKFPLFDDDKPNDHIDIKDINKLVPNKVKPK